MKNFRFVLALAVLLVISGVAHAYRINVLDPYTTYEVPGQPFSPAFAACDALQLPVGMATSPGQFCFSGVNTTGSTITTLELIFPDQGPLVGQTPTCAATGDSLFANSTCGVYNGFQVFYFSGLNIIDHSQVTRATRGDDSFTIYIDGLPAGTNPADLPQAQGTFPPSLVIPTAVPEPSSVVLLSTGLASMGAAAWNKRRTLFSRNN